MLTDCAQVKNYVEVQSYSPPNLPVDLPISLELSGDLNTCSTVQVFSTSTDLLR